jgi:hypothetical protein
MQAFPERGDKRESFMALLSQQYVTAPDEAELAAETGWPEVRRGLNRILLAHLVLIGLLAGLVGLVLYVATQPLPKHPDREVSAVEVVALLALAGFFFAMLYCLVLAVRGHWGCLMHAPERYAAKWFMFAVILFRLVSPTIGFAAGFLSIGLTPPPESAHHNKAPDSAAGYVRDLQDYPTRVSEDQTGSALMVLSGLVALAADVAFILFLRAVARCFEDDLRVRLADIYLLLVVGLFVAGVAVQFAAPELRTDPRYFLAMAGGYGVAFLWYLGLLLSTSTCIAGALERPRAQVPPVTA